jgi:hypothetical protein
MTPSSIRPVIALVAVMLAQSALQGQEQPREPAAQAETSESELRNEAAVILAGTWEIDGDTFFTFGSEYERRLTPRIGVIGEVEYLFDADTWIVAAPVAFHPGHGVKIFGGPGFERADEEGETATHLLLRLGAGYTREFAERYSLGPAVSFDFIRESGEWEHAVVVAITFGMAF